MNQVHDTAAWSLYWSQDTLYSCVAQASNEDQKVLDERWHRFAKKLGSEGRLLDLATGNGAVPKALLAVNPTLEIDAVDKASIDPTKFLKQHSELASVNFLANTDVLNLPLELSSYDAITSQFGIEYAGFEKASISTMRHLKVGGTFQFVVHHAQSGIVQSSKTKIIELEQLVESSGILETLIKVLGGKAELSQLESVGQDYLQRDLIRTKQISGQVFAGIEQIIHAASDQAEESLKLGVAMDLRVRSELARLRQLIAAGQTKREMESWLQAMSEIVSGVEFKALYLDTEKQDYLLAWLATGERRK